LSRSSTCFGQFLCPSSGVFHCTFGTGKFHAGFWWPFPSRVRMELQSSSILTLLGSGHQKPAWNLPVPNVQWKTPDDGQRNCPKHVELLDKNKFGKLLRLLVLLKWSLLRCTVTRTLRLIVCVLHSRSETAFNLALKKAHLHLQACFIS
jgi:hypothetical protein